MTLRLHRHATRLLRYLDSQVVKDFGGPGVERRHQVVVPSGEEDSVKGTLMKLPLKLIRFVRRTLDPTVFSLKPIITCYFA